MQQSTAKKILASVIVAAAVLLFWHFKLPIEKFSGELPQFVKNISSSPVAIQIQSIGEQVFAPPPLRGSSKKTNNQNLTAAGVIYWTNLQRNQNGGLAALAENAKLNQAAQLKLEDLFKKQYFEHVSPSGVGPSGLAKQVGYGYIAIGENLAMGFFDNNQALVQAWMDSPGHRANILNLKFEEIGVAVGQGMYEGKETWMAVQEFGRPQNSCPTVDANLKTQISSLQAEADILGRQLTSTKAELDAENPKTPAEYDAYNQKVGNFNNLVKIYNNKIDILKSVTSQYNNQVSAYNFCLGK